MIPTKTYEQAIVSDNTETVAASISLTPEVFELLSAGIYEDRPLAIVREISCNARDAQAEANNLGKEIEIHLPNEFEPFFSVRDFGTGLTQEQVFKLYMTWGESTKRESNDTIGMLGIGSKSPLSYTDSFLITSYIDGLEQQYSVFKDKGYPKVSKMYEKPTEEENGLKIVVPILRKDFNVFKEKVSTFFKLFDSPVKIIGGEVDTSVEIKVKKDIYWLVDNYDAGYFALMGGVPYKIPSDIASKLKTVINTRTIILPFEIGELNFASSRENLSFTEGDETYNKLNFRVQEVIKGYYNTITDAIEAEKDLTTFYKVKNFLNEKFNISNFSSEVRNNIYWKGVVLQNHYDAFNKIMSDGKFRTPYLRRGKRATTGNIIDLVCSRWNGTQKEVINFVSDRKTGNVKACTEISKRNYVSYVTIDATDEIKTALNKYHGYGIKEISCSEIYEELFPKSETTTKKTYKKVSGVFIKETTDTFKEVVEITGEEEGYYVEMVRDSVEFEGDFINKQTFIHLVDKEVLDSLWFIRKTAAKKNRPKKLIKLDGKILTKILTNKIPNHILRDLSQCKTFYSCLEYFELSSRFEEVSEEVLKPFPTLRNFGHDETELVKRLRRVVNKNKNVYDILTNSLVAYYTPYGEKVKRIENRLEERFSEELLTFKKINPILWGFNCQHSWEINKISDDQLILFIKQSFNK